MDTGITPDHPSFKALPEDKLADTSLRTEDVERVWKSLHAAVSGKSAADTFVSTKIPFAYNYAFNMLDTSHASAQSDHGTHVAGIAAANRVEGTEVVGVAPDAQIIVMQVFAGSGAEWDVILAALEDCVILGVDAVNLSLGSTAGFTDPRADTAMLEVMSAFDESGIQLLAAAGNDINSGYQNLTGTGLSKIENPDTGLVGSPHTFSAAVSVSSADNDFARSPYIVAGGRTIPVTDTAVWLATNLTIQLGAGSCPSCPYPGMGSLPTTTG